jgi:hypothetical protein
MTKFTAKRDGSDFILKADGVVFGRLADCEVTHIFVSEDEQLEQFVGHRIEGDMSVREMLAEVRKGYEAYAADLRAEHESEAWAENAWLRAAEYSPEAYAEMVEQDMWAAR